eukprot:3932364-Rhodomonas_salina.1
MLGAQVREKGRRSRLCKRETEEGGRAGVGAATQCSSLPRLWLTDCQPLTPHNFTSDLHVVFRLSLSWDSLGLFYGTWGWLWGRTPSMERV